MHWLRESVNCARSSLIMILIYGLLHIILPRWWHRQYKGELAVQEESIINISCVLLPKYASTYSMH